MVHAEANAVINAARTGNATPGCFLYVNKFPCYGCLQAIIQAGITRIYTDDKAYWRNDRQDPDHDGKKFLIDAAELEVVAPNHSDFKKALPRLSKSKPPPPRNSEPPPSHH
jgi:deoxycytidylate deaminase